MRYHKYVCYNKCSTTALLIQIEVTRVESSEKMREFCLCVCVCVSRMLQRDAIGNSSKDDIILYDDMQFVFKNPSCFFFQWSRCLFAVPQFDHFDHILRQFRWADSLDFTMILPWIFGPTFSSCSQKMNGSLYSPVTRWKEEFKHLIPTSEI